MFKLEKEGKIMEVRTELQASVFLSNGWKLIKQENEVKEQKEENVNYKKSDIALMKVSDLKVLATKIGIEVTEESTGAKLKEEIIAKLGL